MKQYRYVVDYDCNFTEMIGSISHLPEYLEGKHCFMQMFEPDCDEEGIQRDIDFINSALPSIELIGMTGHGALSRETHSIPYRVCTLLFFDSSDFRVNVFDCTDIGPAEAGEEFKKDLAEVKNIKGVLMMSSDFDLCPERFIDKINEFDQDIVVFGALAGTPNMGDDRSKVFLGNKIYERAIVTAIFSGEDLHLDYYYNLGFKSLGKELVVTKSDDTGLVYEINGKPAFNIYRDHLGIGMNRYFFENTSSFPLFMLENGNPLARVALDYTKDGALAFATEIPEGTSVSLSYSTADILLDETSVSAIKLNDFCPEAVLMYVCMSRRMLMGDKLAELEFEFYENVLPTATWGHGYGEILHADGLRGFLNASCVVIGMREGEKPAGDKRPRYPISQKYLREYLADKEDGFVPLPIRLINFLESTTKDLRSAVDQLFKEASVDELTQVYNRRALNHFLKRIIDSRLSYNGIAVMMFDVDHFKNVNDTYGHDVGDIVLKESCRVVKNKFNQNDILGRWGGEEFVAIKLNITRDDAEKFANDIRIEVAEKEFPKVGHITVSGGVTMVRKMDDAEGIFKRIDNALYEAKETGRNKIVYIE